MDDNEELYPPLPQDISNAFSVSDLSSHSSSDSAKYKRAWLKAKVIRSSILSARECPDACSRALYIVLNHKDIASIMAVTGAILPKNMPMQLPDMNKRKKLSRATSFRNKKTNRKYKNFVYSISLVPLLAQWRRSPP